MQYILLSPDSSLIGGFEVLQIRNILKTTRNNNEVHTCIAPFLPRILQYLQGQGGFSTFHSAATVSSNKFIVETV